ncbi:hypothetical protein RAD16_27095 [Bradyrhizobium sp. 18BD]
MAIGGFRGGAVVARPGWGGGAVVARPGWGGGAWRGGWRPGWGGGWAGWRPGWRGGWGGWGFPIAAGVAAGIAASSWDYGYPYAGYDQCLFWDGFTWVNGCDQPSGYWW